MAEHIFTGFGFGPIQGGLFAKEAFQSGNFARIAVAEIDAELVDGVGANKGSYYVNVAEADGIETLKEIKKTYPLVEVVMLTAHATVESAIEGMKLGAYDYLMKPCEIEQLMEKVEGATKKRRLHQDKIREAQVKEALSTHGLE